MSTGATSVLGVAEPGIDLEREVEVYEAAMATELGQLNEDFRQVAESMPAKVKEGLASTERWTGCFSRLTLLYPLVQAEGLDGVDPEAARACSVAQSLFVLHAFIDDHLLDGQMTVERDEGLFDRWLVARALEILAENVGRPLEVLRAQSAVHHDYMLTQTRSYLEPPPDLPKGEHWPRSAAAGRAGLGWLSTLALLRGSGCAEELVARAKQGFDHLFYGLQWMDDLEDWKGDLEEGRENLLLFELEAKHGVPRADLGSEGEALAHLGRSGVLEGAMEAGKAEFELAQQIARELGCRAQAYLLQRKINRVEDMQRRYARARSQALVNVLQRLIEGSGSERSAS